VALLSALPAAAHEVRPAYLAVAELEPGRFSVLWKIPMRGDLVMPLATRFPDFCTPETPPSRVQSGAALVARWTMRCESSLVGQSVVIEGLENTLTDVLVRYEPLDGASQTARVMPTEGAWVVPERASRWDIARTYLLLGVEHILGGIDHLLFVLALLLIVRGRWVMLKTVTAFTIAHSLTLAAAVLGLVRIPVAPVEAVIALSILFLASELAHSRQGRPGLTERAPWLVAFAFGLLHGFGFAGALAEVGLPENAIPLALFLFNVGVEVGQLLFIAAVVAGLALLARFNVRWPEWGWRVPTYAIGGLSAFWLIERVTAFW
jgi:hydrogenase/urease accessory protein HupE